MEFAKTCDYPWLLLTCSKCQGEAREPTLLRAFAFGELLISSWCGKLIFSGFSTGPVESGLSSILRRKEAKGKVGNDGDFRSRTWRRSPTFFFARDPLLSASFSGRALLLGLLRVETKYPSYCSFLLCGAYFRHSRTIVSWM